MGSWIFYRETDINQVTEAVFYPKSVSLPRRSHILELTHTSPDSFFGKLKVSFLFLTF